MRKRTDSLTCSLHLASFLVLPFGLLWYHHGNGRDDSILHIPIGRLRVSEITAFCEELSLLLGAFLPVLEAMDAGVP